jgi:hypothetical protein
VSATDRDRPRTATAAGFGDTLAFAFADAGADLFGLVRLSVTDAPAAGGPVHAAALVLTAGSHEPVALAGAGPGPPPADWDGLRTGDLAVAAGPTATGWSLRASGPGVGLELAFERRAPAAHVLPAGAFAPAASLESEAEPGRVTGTVRVGSREAKLDGPGQRLREWGVADWTRLALRRSLALWLEEGRAVIAWAARPVGADGHGAEATAAVVFEGEPPAALPIADARLSVTTDAEGRPVRAGLELWESEDSEFPRRAAAEAIGAADVSTAGLRLGCGFLRGSMDGRSALGIYEVTAPEGAVPRAVRG